MAISFVVLSLTACPTPGGGGKEDKTITGIDITTQPDKTQYVVNEELDITGMVVTATYSDGSSAAVTGYTTSGYNKAKTGNQTITVSYNGQTVVFEVNVSDPSKPTVATPTVNPAAGVVISGTSVTLTTTTAGAEIWYTTNGNTPAKNDAGSAKYANPFAIIPPITIKAIAVKDGMNDSAVLEAAYTKGTVATPTASPPAGTYTAAQSVTLTTTTTDAKIYYTTDGTSPSTSSALYSGAINIGATTTLKAIAVKEGMNNSSLLTAEYTINIPIQLTENIWADVNITTKGGGQWFKFTATASTQYIHADFGTLRSLYVQVYDSSNTAVGTQAYLYGTRYVSQSVTVGQEYYIRVSPGDYVSGTYKIAFNASSTTPAITLPSSTTTLTVNTWAFGNIPASSGEQWFKFTATASTQFIHVNYGTLDDLYVQVYDSSGAAVENELHFYGSYYKSNSSRVTAGQEYYIKVWPYSSSNSGTYQITFNASSIAPAGAIKLTENTWADGNLPTSSSEQWFKFTATASTQYIHANYGKLFYAPGLYVQVYDSNGDTVGVEKPLYPFISLSVTVGQEYYIKVWPFHSDDSGTYKIAFNASSMPPVSATLTVDTWADGNLTNISREQWFKFTATASTQYIHASFGTLDSLYVQMYNSSGAAVGTQGSLYGTRYVSQSVTAGQEYYIKISSDDSGTYKIAFNASSTPPPITLPSSATPLTVNTWANGNIPTDGEQWFKFTATASTQFIHINFGTLQRLFAQVYDSNGAAVGDREFFFEPFVSWTVTVGQVYYIKVWPPFQSGTYKIAFNASATAPAQ